MDFFGIPVETPHAGPSVSALPIRAYNLIFNEFYRDQDLTPELNIETNKQVQNVAWAKDYFTAARPWPQKGGDVLLPLGDEAPVVFPSGFDLNLQNGKTGAARFGMDNSVIGQTSVTFPGGIPPYPREAITVPGTSTSPAEQSVYLDVTGKVVLPNNAYADLADASAVDVRDVRLAFALQRYEEARSRYGSRYTE